MENDCFLRTLKVEMSVKMLVFILFIECNNQITIHCISKYLKYRKIYHLSKTTEYKVTNCTVRSFQMYERMTRAYDSLFQITLVSVSLLSQVDEV
jgi:hypothetical protein